MGPFKQIFLALAFICICQASFSQGLTRPNGFSGHVLFIDHKSPMEDQDFGFDQITNGLEFAYHRYFTNYLGIRVPFKAGLISVPEESFDNKRTFASFDATLEARFLKRETFVSPYVFGGVGAVMERDEDMYTQFPVGLGFNFKVGNWGYFTAQAEYRIGMEGDLQRDNLQYGVGLAFLLGKPDPEEKEIEEMLADSDNDGIPDVKDKCKDVAGVAAFSGCPDTDKDGIGDDVDECPEEVGTKEAVGCPDADMDGVSDTNDECPELAGTVNGCPDADEDGIADKDDECPEKFGVADKKGCPEILDSDGDGIDDSKDECPDLSGTANGCPDSDNDGMADYKDPCPNKAGEFGCPDSDGDGVLDNKDGCPTIAGPPSNSGCPTVSNEVKSVLNYAVQNVLFRTGTDDFIEESFGALDQVLVILLDHPYYKLRISGHTDNVGRSKSNQVLSEKRAKACVEYLVNKGIPKDRLSYIGYGEDKPVAENSSDDGRRLNRRVEFEILVDK